MNASEVNAEVSRLVENWCDRREYYGLAELLPAWISNNGLTDGWTILRDALRHTYAFCDHLPLDERELLKTLYVKIDQALQ